MAPMLQYGKSYLSGVQGHCSLEVLCCRLLVCSLSYLKTFQL